MRIGWLTAVTVALITGLAFYFFEDLRQSQIDLSKEPLSDLSEEEKEVVRKKIKKPEPKPEQVEEIARYQKDKKEEEMRREVRKLKVTVIEMEELAEERKKDLRKMGLGDRIDELVVAIARQSKRIREQADENEDAPEAVRSYAVGIEEQSLDLVDIHRQLVDAEGPTGRLGDLRKMLPVAESIRLLAAGEGSIPEPVMEEIRPFRSKASKNLDALERDAEELIKLIPEAIEKAMAEAEELRQEHPELSELADADLEHDPISEQLQNLPLDSAIAEAGADQLYEMSQELSEQFAQSHAEARAAEMAAIQGESFEQAMQNTFVPPSDFPPMPEGIQPGEMPQTMPQFQEFNQSLTEAASQMQNAALRAENQLSRMQPSAPEMGRSMPTTNNPMMRARMASAATTQGFVDMSQVMSTGFQGEFLTDLSKQVDPRYGSISPTADASFGPNIEASRRPPFRVSNARALTQAVPARIIRPEAERRGWLFIDTWYIIGPWAPPPGPKLETPLPPEITIDLDATYRGRTMRKTGEPADLEWRFVQSNTVRVTPPDETTRAVYFAYTELFFEEETTALLGIAADDWAKFWLNDLLIVHDTRISSWNATENFRKVTFRKGINTFLLRLENGGGRCNFSVIFIPLSEGESGRE